MDIQTDPTPLKTAQVYLARLSAGDVAGLETIMTEDFTWSFLPKSLGIPVRTKPQFVTQLKTLGAIFASLKLRIVESEAVVQSADAVVMHLVGEGETAKGVPFHSEYVWTVRCEGAKVRSVTEFSDSKYMHALFEAVDGYPLLRSLQ